MAIKPLMLKKGNDPIDPGIYEGRFIKVTEEVSKFGGSLGKTVLKLEFIIEQTPYKGRTIIYFASPTLYRGTDGKISKLFQVVSALRKNDPKDGESIQIEELIGSLCKLQLENVEGGNFQRIVKVLPI